MVNSDRDVASNDVVFISETSLNKDKHTVICVGEGVNAPMPKAKSGRILPASIHSNHSKPPAKPVTLLKNSQRQVLKVKNKDNRSQGKMTLASRVSTIVSELDNIKENERASNRSL
ncbi:hypothetical protein V6N12_050282 [Hibiscus sabdariffa]|uniref:Uncharacterized protein n=1 Tax=Hibiscus sabdariffa TaxID=183260 RepID=A0ABR2GBX6_9ROSI